MGLLSKFKRRDEGSPEPSTAPEAVLVARTRARRRLIGAVVLLAIGLIGFPLVFETQPRPIPVDIPIEIPRKEQAAPLVLPPARPASAVVVAPVDPPDEPASAPTPLVAAPADAARATPSTASGAAAAPTVAAPATVVAPVAGPSPASAAQPAKSASTPKASGAAATSAPGRASAGAAASSVAPSQAASAPRLVVQVGAYTEAAKLREARQKVEKLGMTTYTQVIEADGGKRTRVRVGPFGTREEAEKAAARIKAAGLPAAILTL